MPRTPDDFPGIDKAEGIRLYDDGYGLPGSEREIRYSDGCFYFRDAYGVINARTFVYSHTNSHLGEGEDSFYVIAERSPTVFDDGYEVGFRWIDTIDGYEFVLIDNTEDSAIWRNTTLSGGSGGLPGIHGYTHISGASDEIDGDLIDISYIPENYTPDTTPEEVDYSDELTSHLAGIDGYLGDLGQNKLDKEDHKTLRHLIHFIEEGPAGGFATGAYKEVLPIGDPFPTQIIWWESSSKLQKIVEKNITRNINQTPSTIQWKMYDTNGITVLSTVIDTISYSGIFEISRTRSIS